jgi:putative FmdB family regulatory protein
MPTYRYRCAKCGDETEIWQSFDEKPKTRHNGGCGGKLQKVLSPAGIVLKGSGFYKTDNRSSKSGAKNGSNETSKDKGSDSSSKRDSDSSSSSSSSSSKRDAGSSSGSSGKTETAGSSSSSSS